MDEAVDMKISELLSEKFDFVLVDCPVGVEDGFKNALAACKAIVVTNPELSAVRDADGNRIFNTSDIQPIQLVINRVRPNMMAIKKCYLSRVQGILSLPIRYCFRG